MLTSGKILRKDPILWSSQIGWIGSARMDGRLSRLVEVLITNTWRHGASSEEWNDSVVILANHRVNAETH